MTHPTPEAIEMDSEPAHVRAFRPLDHVLGLDGIRGLAVLLVVVGHTQIGFLPANYSRDILDAIRGGFMGVDVFFVLSGFLITALLLTERSRRGRVWFGGFYGRRALRLLPALYFLLAAYAIYTAVTGLPILPARNIAIAGIFYVNNWYPVFHPLSGAPGLGHLWSLSVEEQFYLVWPATLLLLARPRRGALLVPGTCVLIAVVMVRRAMLWSASEPGAWIDMFVRTDNRADSLLVGAVTAMLWTSGAIKLRKRYLGIAGWVCLAGMAVMIGVCSPRTPFLYYGGYTLFAVCVGVVIVATVERAWHANWFFESRPMRLLGRVSYGLYLWHLPVYFAVARYTTAWRPLTRLIAAIVITAVCVTVSWHLIERPALRLRRRFLAQPTAPDVVVPVRRLGPSRMFAIGLVILSVGLLVAYELPALPAPGLTLPANFVYRPSRPDTAYARLLEKPVGPVLDPTPSGLVAHIVNPGDYLNVDVSAKVIPAMTLSGGLTGKSFVTIAVVLNGRIASVVHTATTMLATPQFRVRLPRSALRPGRNDVALYLVTGPASAPRLQVIPQV